MASTSSASFVDQEIKSVGNVLLNNAPTSSEELVNLLDIAEYILSGMEQAEALPESWKDALLPIMKALIKDTFLKSENEDICASVASSLAQLIRIAAPDAPYDDDIMEEIFQLMAENFTKLSQPSGRCYEKVASSLYTMAKVKAFLLMLDLELYGLIVEVFDNFLSAIEVNNNEELVWSIVAIMTDVLEEGEGVPPMLLRPLLSCLKRGNKRAAPVSAVIAARVISNCAATIQPLLKEAVQLEGISLDGYTSTVAYVWCSKLTSSDHQQSNGTSDTKEDDGNVKRLVRQKSVEVEEEAGSVKGGATVEDERRMGHTGTSTGSTKFKMELCALPRKRSRKPSSLILPEEGYDHSLAGDTPKLQYRERSAAGTASTASAEKPVTQHSLQKPSNGMGVSAAKNISLECQSGRGVPEKAGNAVDPSSIHTSNGTGTPKIMLQNSSRKRRNEQLIDLGRATASTCAGPDKDANLPDDVQHPGRELVGQRIKVWWPKDKTFNDCIVHSFDSTKNKHGVLDTDGEQEVLNLRKQRWELIRDEDSHEGLKADVPKADPATDLLGTSISIPHVETLGPQQTMVEDADDSSEDTVSDENIYEIRIRSQDERHGATGISDSESSEMTLDDETLQPRPRSGFHRRR